MDLLGLAWKPRLKELSLGDIYISEGNWEGIIEALRLAQLDKVELAVDFWHNGGKTFFDTVVSRQDAADYIACGGRHPCLTPDSPPDQELKWYKSLFPEDRRKEMKPFVHSNSEAVDP